MDQSEQRNTFHFRNTTFQPKYSILKTLSTKQNQDPLKSRDKNTHFQSLSKQYASKEMKILHNNNRRDLLRKIVKKIQQRAQSFYKYGFKSYEKKEQQGIFQDVFNLQKNKLKGSLSTGQLWSNKDNIYFLKENNMFLNKKNLVEQLKQLKEEIKRSKDSRMEKHKMSFTISKEQSIYKKQSQLDKSNNNIFSMESFKSDCFSLHTIKEDQIKQAKRNLETVEGYKTGLKIITRKLKRLKIEKVKEDSIMDYLQKNQRVYQKIRQNYSDKLFLLN